MAASDPSLTAFLQAGLATLPPGDLLVGYSGGIDSHVLLHALAQLPAAWARGLRALHVDHGLLSASGEWAQHAVGVCGGLDIPLRVVAVRVEVADDGLEAAARRARWAAFQAEARAGEILVLAHHRDDQAETVLLRLLRGAGPAGLAAMHPWSVRASGLRVWRPWLGRASGTSVAQHRPDAAGSPDAGTAGASASSRSDADPPSSADSSRESAAARTGARHRGNRGNRGNHSTIGREQIRAYALAAGLDPVADPANADPRHDRSYLRHAVMPAIAARWPGAAAALAQVARRQADALILEQDAGRALLATAATGDAAVLRWPPLQQAAQARRWAALRLWLASHGVADAGAAILTRIDAEVIGAAVDAGPRLDLGTRVLRRYRDRLYALAPGADAPLDYRLSWDGLAPLRLPGGAGELRLDPVPTQPLPLLVRTRRGGERMQLRVGGPHRDLRLLLQEAAVPPWQRARWPVLWLDGQPAGFADLVMAPPLAARLRQLGAHLRFRPH